jgi:uncharacterized protein (DUF779 family)
VYGVLEVIAPHILRILRAGKLFQGNSPRHIVGRRFGETHAPVETRHVYISVPTGRVEINCPVVWHKLNHRFGCCDGSAPTALCRYEWNAPYTYIYIYYIQDDQKVSVHLRVTAQKVTSNVQNVPRQSPDI